MKFKKLIIISLVCISISLIGDEEKPNQAELRVAKKNQISLYGSNVWGLAYSFNFSKHTSFGLSYLARDYSSRKFEESLYPYCCIYVDRVNVDKDLKSVLFDFRIFPFERVPIYLQGSLGKSLNGLRNEDTQIYSIDRKGFHPEQSVTTLSVDQKPAYLRKIDIGLQWTLDSGLFFDLRLSDTKSITNDYNRHLYTTYAYSNLGNYVYNLQSNTLRGETPLATYNSTSVAIAIGYAF